MNRRLLLVLTALALAAGLIASPASGQGAPEGLSGPLNDVAQVDLGFAHACARLTSGKVMCWGEGGAGRNGDGSISDNPAADLVDNVAGTGDLVGVTQISVGADFACARLNNGQARCWGENEDRQLGTGDQQDGGPQIVENRTGTGPLIDVVQLAAGASHTCALIEGGNVRCWGDNDDGQLGDGTDTDRARPTLVLAVNGPGALSGVTQISAGTNFTCARLDIGELRCWGANGQGQLGRGNFTPRSRPTVFKNLDNTGPLTGVTQVAAGGGTTCARLTTGQARCAGSGSSGALGQGVFANSTLPVRVRTVVGPGSLTNVLSLGAGRFLNCAVVGGGQARCWGDGDDGGLGEGATGDRNRPVAVRNVADSGPLLGVTQIAGGDRFSCARLNTGGVRCFGDDLDGRLGNGAGGSSTTPVVVVAE
jgi:alpha-tubulin suppressor-like RCC1 family protein